MEGNCPVSKHLFMIKVRGGASVSAQVFTILGDIMSKPEEFLEDSVFRIFQVCMFVIGMSVNWLVFLSSAFRKSLKFFVG